MGPTIDSKIIIGEKVWRSDPVVLAHIVDLELREMKRDILKRAEELKKLGI